MLFAGNLTLVADLGSFIVETDTQTSSQLSPEEAALYECLELVGKNISAYLVDGEFSFSGMSQSQAEGDSLELSQVRLTLSNVLLDAVSVIVAMRNVSKVYSVLE